MITSPDSLSKDPKDFSWSGFLLVAVAMIFAAFFFDELFRPMRGVDAIEKALWYVGYGAAYLLIPGVVVLFVNLLPKRWGNGMLRPKRTIVLWGIGLMIFNLTMTALRLTTN